MKKNLMISVLLMAFGLFVVACDKKSDVASDTKVENSSQSELNLVSGKVNIIFVTNEHCGSCEELKNIMKHNKINDILAKDFNIIYVDIDNSQNLPDNLEVPYGTPTLYFLDASGAGLIDRMIGLKEESEFESILVSASEAYRAKYPNAK